MYALASLCFCLFFVGEITKCKKTNENERQITFNCVSLLVCFHAFLMCSPFVVCSCVFSICVRVWCFFCDFHVCPISFCDVYLRRWHVLSPLCALPLNVGEIPNCTKTTEHERQITFNCVPFWCVLMPFWCVFALLCVDVSFRYVFARGVFSYDVYLRRWHLLSPLCALPLFVGEIPKCTKTNENERQITFTCVSLLVCFHAFLICSPFVVCSCVFSICVRVWFFFCDFHVCPISFCDVYLCRWHVLSPLCAFPLNVGEIPKCKKTNENEKQITFNCVSLLVCFHAYLMCFPFVVCSCVFSICVRVWRFFRWFSCVSKFVLRLIFVQMTCALASLRFASVCGRHPKM